MTVGNDLLKSTFIGEEVTFFLLPTSHKVVNEDGAELILIAPHHVSSTLLDADDEYFFLGDLDYGVDDVIKRDLVYRITLTAKLQEESLDDLPPISNQLN